MQWRDEYNLLEYLWDRKISRVVKIYREVLFFESLKWIKLAKNESAVNLLSKVKLSTQREVLAFKRLDFSI